MVHLNLKNNKEALILIGVFVIVLLASAVAVYLIAGGNKTSTSGNLTQVDGVPATLVRPSTSPTIDQSQRTPGFFEEIFSTETQAHVTGRNWWEILAKITIRLSLAALLGAALAYRPRRPILAIKRNPYVAQTQILLAVVASALMIIVGDNAARAFGIFAAVSLVRFRTNIRDPKEITVLLISLAIGLAAGVGHWDLALVLAVFSLILLWLLEYREPEQVFRSMQLKIMTQDVAGTHDALQSAFKKYHFDSELRAIARETKEPGTIVYAVEISPTVTTDELTETILALDSGKVDSLEWDQKKSFSYLYQ